MNWLLRILGYHDREYHGDGFSVRIDPGFRELVSIVLTRGGTTRTLDGERIGKRWEGISVHLPREVEPGDVPQIVRDLETAFTALDYGYVISRTVAVEAVSEADQQAAMAELNQMGFEVEVSADRLQTSLQWKPGVRPPDIKTFKSTTPQVMYWLQSLTGRRPQIEVLAKSKGFTNYLA
jgi:hypothetical protein